MEFNYNEGYTHAGKFHADDVFATAFLRILNPKFKVHRVFTVPEKLNDDAIVYDIGRGKFDHHQPDAEVRLNGVQYAAFGLLWREFGQLIFEDEEILKNIDQKFIQGLDHNDNTGSYNPISAIISDFNPCWNEETTENKQFFKAVDFAQIILERLFAKKKSVKDAYKIVRYAYKKSDKKIVTLKRYAPYKEALIDTETLFVIFPSNRGGGFNAVALSISETNNNPRIPFPENWSSLENKELEDVSGIKNLDFCHKNRFLIHGKTIEAVKMATENAIEIYNNLHEKSDVTVGEENA